MSPAFQHGFTHVKVAEEVGRQAAAEEARPAAAVAAARVPAQDGACRSRARRGAAVGPRRHSAGVEELHRPFPPARRSLGDLWEAAREIKSMALGELLLRPWPFSQFNVSAARMEAGTQESPSVPSASQDLASRSYSGPSSGAAALATAQATCTRARYVYAARSTATAP